MTDETKATGPNAPYWEACARHELVVPRCGRCGTWFFRPQPLCVACGADDWAWTRASGEGTLDSFTVVHRGPTPDFPVPYVLATVELAEGATMFSHVADCDPDDLRFDMPLRVAFRDLPDGRTIPVFRPA